MKIIDLKQGSPEWLEWRKSGIGSSDAAVIYGCSPYKTVRELFIEKSITEEIPVDPSKQFIFEKGHRTESVIRNQLQERLKCEITPACFEHPDYPFIKASLDGYNEQYGILEAKLCGQVILKTARNEGEIPLHHFIQIQHQFLVTGMSKAFWFGHDGKKAGVEINIQRCDETINKLLTLELGFWDKVTSQKLPELSDEDFLVVNDDNLFNKLKREIEVNKNSEIAIETLKKAIIEKYKHVKIESNGIRLFQVNKKGSIDYNSIPEIENLKSNLSPEYLETFRKKDSNYWTLKID